MYRPTIRCADVYKDYLTSLSDVTRLDRNQIIRLALFAAPFNKLFLAQLERYSADVTLPHPDWEAFEHWMWLEQCPNVEEKREDDVNANISGAVGAKEDIGSAEQRGSATNQPKLIGCNKPSEGQQREVFARETEPGGRVRINNQGGIKFRFN